jgi:hypothetical protein
MDIAALSEWMNQVEGTSKGTRESRKRCASVEYSNHFIAAAAGENPERNSKYWLLQHAYPTHGFWPIASGKP